MKAWDNFQKYMNENKIDINAITRLKVANFVELP